MQGPVAHETVATAVLEVFDETFAHVHGIYLDRGTSLLETLAGVTAHQASLPMGHGGATIAAHVAHVVYYLEVLERDLLTGEGAQVDWGETWRTVRAVDSETWGALRGRVQVVSSRIREHLAVREDWNAPDRLALALAMVVHSAHHLGEIRQALAWIST